MENNEKKTILDNEKIIFSFENSGLMIDSVFTFKDHDFLIFEGKISILYDGKTLEEKLKLKVVQMLFAICQKMNFL